jgi:hypothetical protein
MICSKLYTECFKKSFTDVTVWPVLRKRLHLKAYKLSIVQHLLDADRVVRKEFCMQIFHTPQMLRSVWQEIDYTQVCRITSGSRIEP